MAKLFMIVATLLIALSIPALAQESANQPDSDAQGIVKLQTSDSETISALREALDLLRIEMSKYGERQNLGATEKAIGLLMDYVDEQLKIEQRMTAVLPVKYVKPQELVELLSKLGAEVSAHPGFDAITVTGTDKQLEVAAGAVEMLDKPKDEERPRNIIMTVHLIRGSNKEGDVAVPEPLAAVVEELRGVFVQYSQYEVIETFVTRSRDNTEVELTGMLPPSESGDQPRYSFGVNRVGVQGAAASLIELEHLTVGLQVPLVTGTQQGPGGAGQVRAISRVQYMDIGIKADIDVPVGQQVVVGKANYGDGDSALFVVISAEVIDL